MVDIMETHTQLLLMASILMVGLMAAALCVFVIFLINRRRIYAAITLMLILGFVFGVDRFLLN